MGLKQFGALFALIFFNNNVVKRTRAHFQQKEPIFEYIFSYLRFRKILKRIPENSELLDLGCGFSGSLLKKASMFIRRGVGIDLAVDRHLDIVNISLFEHDLNEKLSLKSEDFDIITSLAVIEHLNNYNVHISECSRVLKKDGFLMLTTPTPRSKKVLELMAKLGLISKREIMDHKKYFYLSELIELAKNAGFKEVKGTVFQLGFNNLIIAKK